MMLVAPDAYAKKHVRVVKHVDIVKGKKSKSLVLKNPKNKTRAANADASDEKPSGKANNDGRYADVIMNPVTGEIYHQENATSLRHPASLTKMMTLYLLFDALKKEQINLDDRLAVSAYAARMPQTNLALSEGDRIDVETAIKALVVRSANDVAVVVAEKLGGNVENFVSMMNKKARQLGMTRTVFKNPNGLPNNAQISTALDMARLGIALKRDFPRYYRYFSTLQFSYNGVNYYTHNRVMLRYAGADGIKTGYIGASGFNVVTSVVRGGRPLVGVVMGGASGTARDNRMIELLDEAYEVIASRGAQRGTRAPDNLPLPKPGEGSKGAGIDANEADPKPSAITTTPAVSNALPPAVVNPLQQIPESQELEDGGDGAMMAPVANFPAPTQPIAPSKPVSVSPFEVHQREVKPAIVRADSVSSPPPVVSPARTKVIELSPTSSVPAPKPTETLVMDAPKEQLASPQSAPASASAPITLANPPVAAGADWGIQVGAFSSNELALQALKNAISIAPKALAGAKVAVMGPDSSGVPVHRARFENLSQSAARKACEILINNNSPCFIFNATSATR